MGVLFVTLFVVLADQITKFLVKGGTLPLLNITVKGMKYGQSFDVFGSFLKITFVENPGMAFGIDVGVSSKLFLSLFSLVASIGILLYLYKVRNQKIVVRLALALILGGAIGNLIDRTFYGVFYGYAPLFYGKVVDFFNMDFFDFTLWGHMYDRFPIFNIADASVTIGVVMLLFFHRIIDTETETTTDDETLGENDINRGTVTISYESSDDFIEALKTLDNDGGNKSKQEGPGSSVNYVEDNNREKIKI